jgi:hypothetical protein
MKRLVLASAALLTTACATPATAPAPAAQPWSSPEEAAILEVVDKVLLAIGNHDKEAQRALMVPEGTTFLQRRTDAQGDGPVMRRSNEQLISGSNSTDPFIERYWDPIVLVRGGLAMVWMPYELRDNGQVVHCGINAFDMVKIDGAWKVGNMLSSFEPDACDEIKPPSVGAMRPRNGWKETPLQ